MKVTILNGNPDAGNAAFDGYVQQLAEALAPGHQVTVLQLRDMDIHYCAGCWGCWIKTPGECVAHDDSQDVCRAVIRSDLTLFASPLMMGFVSALLKKATDKLIPLVHPYAVVDQYEAHHLARYPAYPLMGLLLQKGEDADDQDVAITADIYSRTALNIKSKLALTRLTLDPVEEVVDAINRL